MAATGRIAPRSLAALHSGGQRLSVVIFDLAIEALEAILRDDLAGLFDRP